MFWNINKRSTYHFRNWIGIEVVIAAHEMLGARCVPYKSIIMADHYSINDPFNIKCMSLHVYRLRMADRALLAGYHRYVVSQK